MQLTKVDGQIAIGPLFFEGPVLEAMQQVDDPWHETTYVLHHVLAELQDIQSPLHASEMKGDNQIFL